MKAERSRLIPRNHTETLILLSVSAFQFQLWFHYFHDDIKPITETEFTTLVGQLATGK